MLYIITAASRRSRLQLQALKLARDAKTMSVVIRSRHHLRRRLVIVHHSRLRCEGDNMQKSLSARWRIRASVL